MMNLWRWWKQQWLQYVCEHDYVERGESETRCLRCGLVWKNMATK